MNTVGRSYYLFVAMLYLVAASAFYHPQASAQVTTSEIDGRITDQKGDPIEDIQVVARSQETGNYQITYSEQNG